MKKVKEPVKLRMAERKNGTKSLYLDTISDGVRKYEFLQLYLVPETTPEARAQNTETMRSANAIKARRILELINRKGGVKANNKAKNKITLGVFVGAVIEKHKRKGINVVNYKCLLSNLKKWKKDNIKLVQIDKEFCLDLIELIKKQDWTDSTKFEVQNKITAILHEAKRCDFIDNNPFDNIDRHDKIKTATESKREYLTIEELNRLITTPTAHPYQARAFLFSCFTGLRLSDVRGLRWENLHEGGEHLEIRMQMQKTRKTVIIPLSAEAKKYLPPRGRYENFSDIVFKNIKGQEINKYIQEWAKLAGITKHITFHSARHTFATMLLTLGADIYTISKLLGHTSIQHTQIYAKLVDAKRRDATDLFSGHFDQTATK